MLVKKKAQSLKDSSKEILLLVKLQCEGLPLWLEINSSTDILKYFTKIFCIPYYFFNGHMHRMGLRGPKKYIFSNQF